MVVFCIFPPPSSFSFGYEDNGHQSRNNNKRREHSGATGRSLDACNLQRLFFLSQRRAQISQVLEKGQWKDSMATRTGEVGQGVGVSDVFRLGEEEVTSMGRTRERSGWAILECRPLAHTNTHNSPPCQESQVLVKPPKSSRGDLDTSVEMGQ